MSLYHFKIFVFITLISIKCYGIIQQQKRNELILKCKVNAKVNKNQYFLS